MRNPTKLLVEILTPVRCLSCNKFGLYFCSQCLRTVFLIDKQKCPICEGQSVGGRTHPKCAGRYSLDGLFSLFEYAGIIKTAVTQLKFKRLTDIESELVSLIDYVLKKFYEKDLLVEMEDFIFHDNPTVVPIPLHWLRRLERKFNQAEFVANILSAEYSRLVVPDLLVRVRNTTPQTKLKGKAREDNVKRVFRVRKKYLTERVEKSSNEVDYKIDKHLSNILLVDDVTTTGATLKNAGNILKREGAEKVWALTLAA